MLNVSDIIFIMFLGMAPHAYASLALKFVTYEDE